MSNTEIRPEITADMVDQFNAFGHRTLYPVRINIDIRSKAGNLIAAAGELTWGAINGGMSGSVMVWTPSHYAGVKSSSIMHGYTADYDHPKDIGWSPAVPA